jgi:gluconokinase
MIVLVMGVSGSGKTTVGQLLAKSLNWGFSDADEYHPKANIEKMSHGIPLNDADREPWLQAMQAAVEQWLQEDKNMVLAASLLKAAYRERLLRDKEHMRLVYLKGSYELLKQRMEHRPHHFMKVDMLKSQFDTLEEPTECIQMDDSELPEAIVQKIRASLGA